MLAKQKRIKSRKMIEQVRKTGYCEVCGATNDIEAHHIKTKASGGHDREDNLICLCWWCHRKAHDGNIAKGKLMEIVNARIKAGA